MDRHFTDQAIIQELNREKQRLEDTQVALLNLLDDLQSVEQIRALGELKDRFLALVSHELRTPLTSIHGFSSTLVARWGELTDAEKQAFVEIIDEQAARMGVLIDDVLALSEINSGALRVDRQVVDVRAIADEVAHEFRAAGISVIGGDDLYAFIDPRHLRQAITNLVGNAVKYGAPPIIIEVIGRDDWVDVRVVDHGPGIDPAFVPNLFEEFARADDPAIQQQKGSGLGLAIVRRLMTAQGANTWYERVAPQGTCFVLRLPLSERRISAVMMLGGRRRFDPNG